MPSAHEDSVITEIRRGGRPGLVSRNPAHTKKMLQKRMVRSIVTDIFTLFSTICGTVLKNMDEGPVFGSFGK